MSASAYPAGRPPRRATVVFESMFGNTEELATAVALGLREAGMTVVTSRAGDDHDHDLHGCDLLVLAAPTHALTLSTTGSRADAVARGADPRRAVTGLREWLDDWPPAGTTGSTRAAPEVAVFDTRARIARHWPGSAARRTARTLRRRGHPVAHVASFYVDGVTGPVLAGELDRARAWGSTLASGGEGVRDRAGHDGA